MVKSGVIGIVVLIVLAILVIGFVSLNTDTAVTEEDVMVGEELPEEESVPPEETEELPEATEEGEESSQEETPVEQTAGDVVLVEIQDFAFEPQFVTVSVGDTVRWENVGNQRHSVFSIDGSRYLNSEILRNGESFEFTFDEPDKYRYISVVHTSIWGEVTVE